MQVTSGSLQRNECGLLPGQAEDVELLLDM